MSTAVAARILGEEEEWEGSPDGRTPEERQEHMTKLRRYIALLTSAQAVYVLLRTAWHSVPWLLGEDPLTQSTPWILAAAGLVFLVRRLAFGHGRPEHESGGWLVIYFLALYLLMAECGLVMYSYHALWPKAELYPARLARRYGAAFPLGPDGVLAAAQVFEAALDVVGVVALGLGAYFTRDYLMQRKYEKKEQERRERLAADAGDKKED